jgi:hypothetical protein
MKLVKKAGAYFALLVVKLLTLINKFLDYAATNPDAISSHIKQATWSLTVTVMPPTFRTCSRAGGHFFVPNNDVILPSNNGAILTISKITKAVM